MHLGAVKMGVRLRNGLIVGKILIKMFLMEKSCVLILMFPFLIRLMTNQTIKYEQQINMNNKKEKQI